MSRRKQTKPQQLNSPTDNIIVTGICHCTKLKPSDNFCTEYCDCTAASVAEINNNNPTKCEEKEQLLSNKVISKETILNTAEMANEDHRRLGETKPSSIDGNSSHFSNVVDMNANTKENDSDAQSTHSTDENDGTSEEKSMSLTAVGDNMSEGRSPSPQVHRCDECGESFAHLGDFVQHMKTLHCSEQPAMDVEEANNETTHEQELKSESRADEEVVFNSINGTNVAIAQMAAQPTEDDVKSTDNDVSDDETHDVTEHLPIENSGFLSSAAINNVIQSMKHLEQGISIENREEEDGKPKKKVDINGIKDQVKVIQQQQAYQIQMLNYLHWQLAMLSSNPQAAIQQVASTMRNAFPGPMPGQIPGMPPPMPPTTAGGLMPSMMAAMAMNGAASPNMDMATKARMMMNMQNGNPHFRSMFGRTLSGEGNERKHDISSSGSFDPQTEQRYQLQEPPDIETLARAENPDRNMAPSPAKSENNLISRSPSQSFDSISMVTKPELKLSLSGISENSIHHSRDSSSGSPFKDDGSENSAYRHRCKYCQKVFGSDSALQIHLRSHTGERPYKCNICGNRFTTKGNLKVHFMRHKAKYPHIPMNPHPVPEYLDGVPTTTGLPYGMSILPEKAVFERPRLHGNPSIHLNSHTNSAISNTVPTSGIFPYSNLSPEQARPGFPLNGPAEFALMQSQLIERQRQMELMEKRRNEGNESRSTPNPEKDSKPSASMLQMAMMPFFKSGGIGSMIQNDRQNLDGNSDGRSSYSSSGSSSPPHSHRRNPSETSKLQRLVENIDRGRVLQKNECHMCHRVLSCQSALKLHYRTHTGERPHKCDLCSRAFTTRGNLRTHYSSVHRQQLRALPPGGSSRPGSYSCPLCNMRFFEVMEFQRHMHTHAVMHQKNQEEQQKKIQSPLRLPVSESNQEEDDVKVEETENERNISVEDGENDLQIDEENEEEKDTHNESKEEESNALDLSSPSASSKTNEASSPVDYSEESKKEFKSQNLMQKDENERPQLNRSRSREALCEICDKSFSCNSALEIHLRIHTKERPYICRICQQGFTTKGNLKQHLLMHNITDVPEEMLEPIGSPDGRGSNSNSPNSSAASAQYNREMSSPSLKRSFDSDSSGNGPAAKQRQYPRHWCHICQKQFSSASSLQIHTRTHTGEKPFACSVCGRAFTTKGNLKVHMGTHVFGAGGSRRGRRISMDNPLISPWMRNIANHAPAPGMQLPPPNTRADPAMLYQQYAALANGLLAGKQESELMGMNNNRLLAINAGLMGQNNTSPATSPHNSSTSPSQMRMPPAGMNNPAMAQAATEWFLKAYQQRTQGEVN